MQDISQLVKGELVRFRAILSIELSVKTEEVDQLIKRFQHWFDQSIDDKGKGIYSHFLSRFLQRLDRSDKLESYLLSLAEIDIRDNYPVYTTPITTDRQDELYLFMVLCGEAIAGLRFNDFSGIEFVHQYSIGHPLAPSVESGAEIETGQFIDLTKHFDRVSAIHVYETIDNRNQSLWPMRVILEAGRWNKTIVVLPENDFVDLGYGKDIPCHSKHAPLSITIFPHVQVPTMKFYVDVLGKLEMGDSRERFFKEEITEKMNYRGFGFQLEVF